MAYARKTRDTFEIQGNYGSCHGWDTECIEDTAKEARQTLKEYRENGSGIYRMVKKRVKISE